MPGGRGGAGGGFEAAALYLALRAMDAAALRGEFPVLERLAYLNTGTDGPLAASAVRAAQAALDAQLQGGRYAEHFRTRMALQAELRAGYARLVGAPVEEIALTTSASTASAASSRAWRSDRATR